MGQFHDCRLNGLSQSAINTLENGATRFSITLNSKLRLREKLTAFWWRPYKQDFALNDKTGSKLVRTVLKPISLWTWINSWGTFWLVIGYQERLFQRGSTNFTNIIWYPGELCPKMLCLSLSRVTRNRIFDHLMQILTLISLVIKILNVC